MTKFFRRFFYETSGAVTVDWVVLTAAVVGLGLLAAVNVATGTTEMGSNIGTYLSSNDAFNYNE